MLNLLIPIYIKYEYPEFPVQLDDIYDYIDDVFLLTADNRIQAFCMDENYGDESKHSSNQFRRNKNIHVKRIDAFKHVHTHYATWGDSVLL